MKLSRSVRSLTLTSKKDVKTMPERHTCSRNYHANLEPSANTCGLGLLHTSTGNLRHTSSRGDPERGRPHSAHPHVGTLAHRAEVRCLLGRNHSHPRPYTLAQWAISHRKKSEPFSRNGNNAGVAARRTCSRASFGYVDPNADPLADSSSY